MESQDQVLSFPLTNVRSRQIFRYDTGHNAIRILYDSGAQLPVWCKGTEVLMKSYPDAQKTQMYCEISGFGKDKENADVYIIPLFELSNHGVTFAIKNLVIADLLKPFVGCDLIISETMFAKADTTTIRRSKRELQINFDALNRPFICTAKNIYGELSGISVWTQTDDDSMEQKA